MTHLADPHLARPRTDAVPHPSTSALYRLRPFARLILRLVWNVHVWHRDRVPASGPVIVASNHIGFFDGPLLAIFAPRPVHALTKIEMFQGFLGRFLRWAGQIPLDRLRTDPGAVRASLRVLREGRVLGIFPEGARGGGEFARFQSGAAYLAMVSGAPVVPVIFIGTRAPGAGSSSLPRLRSRIDIVFGQPLEVDAMPWPRTRHGVLETSVLVREHLQAELAAALDETGRRLPGPLPVGDKEATRPSGITEGLG